MANWISITRQLQHAYGVASRHVGIPMDVYRVTNTSNGDWIQEANKIATNVFVDRQPMKIGNKGFEGAKRMDTFWFEIMANCDTFQLGDIFVSNDMVLNAGSVAVPYSTVEFIGLCLAENMPTRAPIAARINTNGQLFTPNLVPTITNYYDSTLPNRIPIVCVNGVWTPMQSGASRIPMASMPFRNYGKIYDVPTANVTPSERRLVYVPPLNGYQPIAGDEILFDDGSRYIIENNYHQDSGTVGGQYLCSKIVSGGTQ